MMLYRLLSRMDRGKVSSIVISLTDRGPVADRIAGLGIPVYALGMRRGVPDPRALWRLSRILLREQPAVLQTWLYHADFVGLLAGRLGGVRALAWNIRCSVMDQRYTKGVGGLVLRLLARFSGIPDAVVVNSFAGRTLHQGIGYRPRRWEMIPNGFDSTLFRPDPEAYQAVRRELGLPAGTPLVGLVARVDPIKGHATFLRGAGILARRRPDVRYILIGSGADLGNPTIAGLVREHGLEGKVVGLGERSDMGRLTAALDVATCASLGEGFPNVLGEAMSCAVPVVSTDVGDAAVLLDGVGRIVPIDDAAAMADAWEEVLRLDPAERARRTGAGRQRIEAMYDLSAVADRYSSFYGELAAASAGHR